MLIKTTRVRANFFFLGETLSSGSDRSSATLSHSHSDTMSNDSSTDDVLDISNG